MTTSHLAGGERGTSATTRTVKEKRMTLENEQITRQAHDAAALLRRLMS